jgi:hypothetical protein
MGLDKAALLGRAGGAQVQVMANGKNYPVLSVQRYLPQLEAHLGTTETHPLSLLAAYG